MTRQTRITDQVTAARRTLDTTTRQLPQALAQHRAEISYHLSAQSFDQVIVASGVADPVGSHVASVPERHDDFLDQLDHATRQVTRAVAHLAELVAHRAALAAADAASPEDRRRAAAAHALAERDIEDDNRCCRSCWRTYVIEPQGSNPGVRRRVTDLKALATNVGGRLDRLMPLCRWCWDWVHDTGQLPPIEDVQEHHAHPNRRIRRPA